jgi:hypothetical protein
MRNYVIAIAALALVVSCGRPDPIHSDLSGTDLGREGMAFQTAVQIFAGDVDNPSVDADNAEVTKGPGSGAVGEPWVDNQGNNWGVATAIREDALGRHVVVFRKLGVSSLEVGFTGQTVYTVPFPYIPPPNQVREARLPKVAACYFPDGDPPFVEFAFTYQYLDTSGENDDWECVIARCRFDNPGNGFDALTPYWFPLDLLPDADAWNVQPDIAYDATTGDLYVVCAVYVGPGTSNLYVIKCTRSQNFLTISHGDAVIAQYLGHNSFHPRIDIGQVKFYPYLGNQWLVGVAYTGWSEDMGWHVRLSYWATYENNYAAHDFGWEDPTFRKFPAGLPCIDIGPPGSDHAAMAWMQAKSDDWANSTVIYADTKPTGEDNKHQLSYGVLHPDSTWGSPCSAFPSVAVHKHSGDIYRSSISLLISTDYVAGKWVPTAVAAHTYPANDSVGFGTPVPIPGVAEADGKWDSGTTVEHYFGMTTALTVYQNSYWMVWSGFDPADAGGPTSVWGAFGFTN